MVYTGKKISSLFLQSELNLLNLLNLLKQESPSQKQVAKAGSTQETNTIYQISKQNLQQTQQHYSNIEKKIT